MDYETHDSLLFSLENIKLLKLAHDMGCDVTDFPYPYVNPYYEYGVGEEIFVQALKEIFEIVEVFPTFSEQLAEKLYWLKEAGFDVEEERYIDEQLTVIVILDDTIDTSGIFDGVVAIEGDWFSGYAKIGTMGKGLVISIDEDNGMANCIALMEVIKDITKK